MLKVVNGKTIDIPNIELFQEAFEGMVLNKQITSKLGTMYDGESKVAKVAIEESARFIRSLPFPLYSVESNLKYAIMAQYIRCKVADKLHKGVDCWVDGGLCVRITDNEAIKIVGQTWAVIPINGELTEEQLDTLDIEMYRGEAGYKEFMWCLSRLLDGLSLSRFYKQFMPDFEKACLGETMVLKWELGRMLEFGYVPEAVDLPIGIISDSITGKRYNIDVYWTGKMKPTGTKEKKLTFDLTSGFSCDVKTLDEKEYNYDIYEVGTNEGRKKMPKMKILYIGVFKAIVDYGKDTDNVETLKYSGITDGNVIAMEIGRGIFVGQLGGRLNMIGKNIKMLAMEKGKIYLERETRKESGVVEVKQYAYDIKEERLMLCRIGYKL